MTANDLEKEYAAVAVAAERFSDELVRQLNELIAQGGVSLGFPIQSRVKRWESIAEKLQRRSLGLNSIRELNDLVGLRVLLLFQRDVATVCRLVKENFCVISQEDTRERLDANEFGYTSVHFIVEPPKSWLALPTLKHLQGLKAEIQVRTVAQHIWAAASHVLQYKHEAGVPPPVRRSIHRVSALLETVDLEFERVLEERTSYRDNLNSDKPSEELNVDLLEKILDQEYPMRNKVGDDLYSDLLAELFLCSIKTPEQLRRFILRTKKGALEQDAQTAQGMRESSAVLSPEDRERVENGYWFSHVGLLRGSLEDEFGDEYLKAREKLLTAPKVRYKRVRKPV